MTPEELISVAELFMTERSDGTQRSILLCASLAPPSTFRTELITKHAFATA